MTRTWDKQGWLGLHIAALLLFGTWLLGYWQFVDEKLFWLLNNRLHNPSFAWLVAFVNQRWIDGMVAALMLLFMLHHASQISPQERLRFLALSVIMVAAFLVQVAVSLVVDMHRPSPTNIFPEALRVSKLVPQLPWVKDGSGRSFPSDHGLGLGTFALFAWYCYPRRYFYWIAPLAVLFALPRILSGAHWFTDFMCGALPLVLLSGAWLFHTPLAAWLTVHITRAIAKLLEQWRNLRSL